MNDYGKGGVLGASMLPATSAAGLLLLDKTNSFLIVGLISITALGLIIQISMIIRYLLNRKTYKLN